MESIQIYFLLAALLVIVSAGVAAWSRRRWHWKALALLSAACFIPIVWVAFDDLLSHPKPIAYDDFEAEYLPNATVRIPVLFGEVRDGVGIYVLVRLPSSPEPRYFLFAWNNQLAEELEEGLRQKRRAKQGGELELRRRGSGQPGTEKDGQEGGTEKNWSNERFSVNPTPPLPPKDPAAEEYAPPPPPSPVPAPPAPGRIQT
ncbi:MAG TPA: hypothetical protein VLB83_04650 [Candidatus Paceibacterota bacterium]|nr:hypothetical protein [Candidatus Paceibacterota bacterium]